MKLFILCLGLLFSLELLLPLPLWAGQIEAVRKSSSPVRIRLVFDSKSPITYKAGTSANIIDIEFKDTRLPSELPPIKEIKTVKAMEVQHLSQGDRLVMRLGEGATYKIFKLVQPDRLVVDIYRLQKIRQTQGLASGVNYTFIQDEVNGLPIQAYLVEIGPKAKYELRPFSAAGAYNGRGLLSKAAQERRMLAAINASYFDSDGWVIGTTKDRGRMMSMDVVPRSGYVATDKERAIVEDIAYEGKVQLPNGQVLQLKGMNRGRITNDFVLFNEYYGTSTKTNQWGCEVKLREGKIIAISKAGNMKIEPGTMVLSGHGTVATALGTLKVGQRLTLTEDLQSSLANKASTVISGGPLLLENGKIKVRTKEEQIAPDIARGRAPRTAVALKRDGTLQLLVVDGRNKNSAGLTLEELAAFCLRQGAVEAVNFDGGGSSTMVIKGRVVNKPSDGRERSISMALGLFSR